MMEKIESAYKGFLKKRKESGLYRVLPDVGGDQADFSSNDYLGLKSDSRLIARAKDWAGKYGAGAGASRLVSGNLEIYQGVEDKIAAFKQSEAALVMVSGFQANASVLPALFDKDVLGAEPYVFADRLNHASMHLGCAASGVRQHRYRHNDAGHLEELLKKHAGEAAPKFILTESVFSMDGDIAPLNEISALAKRYGAYLICDEAHATGVLGKAGRGLADEADLVIGTFGKALGSFGAYVSCNRDMKDYLVNRCAGLIYATALPPAVLGAIDAALDIVPGMDNERAHVLALAGNFRTAMRDAGFDCGQSETQIVPLIVGGTEEAMRLSAVLKDNGIRAVAIRPPTVPAGTARIRFAFSASHTDEDVANLITVLKNSAHRQAA